MKKILLIMAACAALACSCKKIVPLSEYPFDVSIKGILFDTGIVDVLPETNDYYYQIDILPAKTVAMYGSDEALVGYLDKKLKDEYQEYKKAVPDIDFKDMLYRGAYIRIGMNLTPETEYVGIAYMYNDDNTPDPHPVKVNFKTRAKVESDITFDLSVTGSLATITPSNNDKWIFTYESRANLDEEYGGSMEFFFAFQYLAYLEYEMLPGLEISGSYTDDMSQYYKLKEGDQLDFIMMGFDYGITSEYYMYRVTYMGEDKPGKVEKIYSDYDISYQDYVHIAKTQKSQTTNARILGAK